MRKVVVIGGSAAGMMAAIGAASSGQDVKVTVVSRDITAYRRPGIPALIAGYISEPAEIEVFSAKTLEAYDIKLICPAEVVGMDIKGKNILFSQDGKEKKLSFDSAVVATGSSPLIPRIAGVDKKGVCTFTTFEGAAEIVKASRSAGCAVVIGAGFIALEIAEALMDKGLGVYFNVRSRILRKLLEPEISEFLMEKFERQGLKMLTGETISQICGESDVEYIIHKGRQIVTGLVIVGAGVKPNAALAEKCGIELGPSGAIKVDSRMQTSVSDIFAAGDCAESPDLSTGRFIYSPVGSIGAMAGKIAGRNAAGVNEKTEGFLRAQADEILGMQIYSIGHSSTTAKEIDLQVKVHELDSSILPEQKKFEMARILTDSKDKVVGAQLVAKRYGSQIAWQMYQAVGSSESREELLSRFESPEDKLAKGLVQLERSGTS